MNGWVGSGPGSLLPASFAHLRDLPVSTAFYLHSICLRVLALKTPIFILILVAFVKGAQRY